MCTLSAGEYYFSYKPNIPYRKVYSVEDRVDELMEINELKEIIISHFPNIIRGIPFQSEAMTLIEILQSPFAEISEELKL